jgi:hypothetical protein
MRSSAAEPRVARCAGGRGAAAGRERAAPRRARCRAAAEQQQRCGGRRRGVNCPTAVAARERVPGPRALEQALRPAPPRLRHPRRRLLPTPSSPPPAPPPFTPSPRSPAPIDLPDGRQRWPWAVLRQLSGSSAYYRRVLQGRDAAVGEFGVFNDTAFIGSPSLARELMGAEERRWAAARDPREISGVRLVRAFPWRRADAALPDARPLASVAAASTSAGAPR